MADFGDGGTPLEIGRSGGIAGFRDLIRVADDGTACAGRRATQLIFELDADLRDGLRAAFADRRRTKPTPVPERPGSDRMRVWVTDGRYTVELGEGQGQDALSLAVAEVFRRLNEAASQAASNDA